MYQEIYKYKAIKNSKVIYGYISADSLKDAITMLRYISSRQIFVQRSFSIFHRQKIDQISEWFLTIFTLLNEGIKIENCLEIINQNNKYKFSITILDLIKAGFSFSEAIKRNSFFFGTGCVRMIDSISGFMKIEEMCLFLHNYYSKIHKKTVDTRKVLLQPIITFILSLTILTFAIVFLKSNTEKLFLDLNIDKPFIFRFVDQLNIFNTFIALLFISLLFLFAKFFFERIPFVSSYYENRDILISFYCISRAISSGVQIVNAIDIAIEVVETKSIFMKLKGVKNCILNGKSINSAFKKQNFDAEYYEIMKVGEMTGKLSESLMSISSLSEEKLSRQFEIISNTLPYLFIFLTSVIIIFFFFSVFIPIYSSVNKLFF